MAYEIANSYKSCHSLSLAWHKARSIGHPVRIKLNKNSLLAKLSNYYTKFL